MAIRKKIHHPRCLIADKATKNHEKQKLRKLRDTHRIDENKDRDTHKIGRKSLT
jgi:hypothetical protein